MHEFIHKTHHDLMCTQKLVTRNDPSYLGGSTTRWTSKISVCYVAHCKHGAGKKSFNFTVSNRPSICPSVTSRSAEQYYIQFYTEENGNLSNINSDVR